MWFLPFVFRCLYDPDNLHRWPMRSEIIELSHKHANAVLQIVPQGLAGGPAVSA